MAAGRGGRHSPARRSAGRPADRHTPGAAHDLAAEGMVVCLGARDHGRGRARELSSGGADVRFVQLGVTDQSQVDAVAREIGEEFGRIDVLVNNAGIGGSRPEVEETAAHDFTAVMDVNLLGAVRTTHTLLPLMRMAEHPRIVNVISGRGAVCGAASGDEGLDASGQAEGVPE
ncbi:SDR family NAD(P)-dependent oxidoreductase [Streptomyces inhibens]|uniref:SDR family NAD(P)-dependent oxidoreductase n=1 Tax=Streptomyces inhibens TaxID=2293571 RepID=UPI0036808FA4